MDPLKQFVTEEGDVIDLPEFPFEAVFNTPFESHQHRIGETVTVIGRQLDADEDVLLYRARFADGTEDDVWPEEVGDGYFMTGGVMCAGVMLA